MIRTWSKRRRLAQLDRVMRALHRDPGPRFITGDLQAETRLRGSIYVILLDLENRGWVARSKDELSGSGRIVYTLTEQGHAVAELAVPRWNREPR